jgi:hypothetical protein
MLRRNHAGHTSNTPDNEACYAGITPEIGVSDVAPTRVCVSLNLDG